MSLNRWQTKFAADFYLKKFIPSYFPIFAKENPILKNYYYFLGVNEDASEEEIRKAYRKLSLKYHPDRNENDDYFSKRFREVQEAYETLINKETRSDFDSRLGLEKKMYRSNFPPVIKTFSANKTDVTKGEEIIIKWNTTDADVVKILPFGLTTEYGERTFKISEFKEGKFYVILHATNTLINKTVVQGLTFYEAKEGKAKVRESVEQQGSFYRKPEEKSKWEAHRVIKLFFGILFLLVAFLLLMKMLEN